MEYMVSVLIPVRNEAKALVPTLKSVLAQATNNDVEIIVIDDGSTDKSVEVVKTFQQEYPEIVLLQQKRKTRLEALNLGISSAKGKYVMTLLPGNVMATGACRALTAQAEANGDDVVIGQVLKALQKKGSSVETFVPSSVTKTEGLKEAAGQNIAGRIDLARLNANWQNLLIRRQFLLDHELWQTPKVMDQSAVYNMELLMAAEKASVLDEPTYCSRRSAPKVTQAKKDAAADLALMKRCQQGKIKLKYIWQLLKAWKSACTKRRKNRWKQKKRYFMYHYGYPLLYKLFCLKPVKKNKILFVESLSDSLTNNFKKLIEAFGQKGDYQCEVWSHNLGTADSESQAKLAVNLLRTAADAKVIFLDDTSPLNCLDAVTVRSQTSVEQLWHGCAAFKKWGYSNANGKFGASAKALKEYPRYRNYRHVFVSSLDVIPYYEEAFNLEEAIGVVTPAGVSRTDVFFDPDFRSEAFQRVYDMVPRAQGKKILLYAPTFRGQVKNAYSPQCLDIALLQQSFTDKYILLIKHHPHVLNRPQIPEELSSFAFDVTDRLSIDDLIMTADVCIADYSSLVFEYALMDRPMIFLADDLEDYCDWRGFFVEYEDFVPGPIARTTDEIIEFIRGLPHSFDRSRLLDFKKTYMSACDGHATQRILDIVMKDMEGK